MTLIIVAAIALASASNLPSAVAVDANTRIADFQATESGGVATVTGVLQYRNASGDFHPLNSSKIKLYWWSTGSALTNYVGEVYSNEKTSSEPGAFSYSWLHALQPGEYFVKGKYEGESWGSYTFKACEENTQLLIRLRLKISIDKPTVSVAQGESVTLTVSVGTTNTNAPHSVSLSAKYPTKLFVTESLTPVSGNTPLVSKLKLDVLNVTLPGTYTVTVTAQSDQDSLVTVSTSLIIYVQQNTHTIAVEIQGLPSEVETSVYIDGILIDSMGTGISTLTISNKTKTVSVLKEIVSGDTLYLCEDYTRAADVKGIDTFLFKYATEYRLKISGDLPQNIVCKLVLKVDDVDKSDSEFKPANGYSEFLQKDATVGFAISPDYITTAQVNYKFREWKELTTGQIMNLPNSTADGLFIVKLSKPLDLRGYYDKWTSVTIKTNLPSELSTNLQIGLVGSEKKNVAVTGSVAYQAGEFLAGAAFECTIPPDQLVLYNGEGNIRYEFQGLSPLSPMTLEQHTSIYINYTARYRVQVISRFPDAVLQPPGGVGWYGPGEIGTAQVTGEAKDEHGIPYLFDEWTGAISSNETIVSFPVMAPMDAYVEWRINWIYLLTIGGGVVGVAVPSAIVVKKKVLVNIRGWRKKSPPKKQGGSQGELTDDDMRVYNYIMMKGGALRLSEAATDLDMTKETIRESVEKLREKQLLH